ncbi:FadR family transcriptional regulator [Cutibacterium sp. WCA-380-WT-3A]|uniref:FadR family transcriptional regulator n=1 Tax=Cutibacterium porci TaxID=2605781 RepID=A0A7K0J7B5_9ACTN|nr:FCD domain-containing protein [Cutibacterium porci]MSS45845.1 FadR family transcriptional regulator [Cutibacterium porci]
MPQEFLASSVASRLGARIVDGDLQAGDVLRLEDIEQESAASRSVCREAVKILESLNLVRSRRHVGVTVLPAGEWDVLSPKVVHWHMSGNKREQEMSWTNELRIAIEPTAARLAAERADGADLRGLQDAVSGMTEAIRNNDPAGFANHDHAFHRSLLAATRNPLYVAHVPMLLSYLAEQYGGRTLTSDDGTNLMQHRDILDAITMHDADAAEQFTRALVLGLGRHSTTAGRHAYA